MKCKVYKSKKLKNNYLWLSVDGAIESLPENIKEKLGELSFFKEVEVSPERPLIAADPKEIIKNIDKTGYHIQKSEIQVRISVEKKKVKNLQDISAFFIGLISSIAASLSVVSVNYSGIFKIFSKESSIYYFLFILFVVIFLLFITSLVRRYKEVNADVANLKEYIADTYIKYIDTSALNPKRKQ